MITTTSTAEEALERAQAKQAEIDRRDAVRVKITRVAQQDARREFLTQCSDLCSKREWTKLAKQNGR